MKLSTAFKRVIPIFILLVINSCIKKLDEQRFVLQGDCDEIQQFVQDSIIKVPAGVYYGEIEKDSIGCTLVVKYDGSKGDVNDIEKKLIEKKWLVKVDSISALPENQGEVIEKLVVDDSIVVIKKQEKIESNKTKIDSTTVTEPTDSLLQSDEINTTTIDSITP